VHVWSKWCLTVMAWVQLVWSKWWLTTVP